MKIMIYNWAGDSGISKILVSLGLEHYKVVEADLMELSSQIFEAGLNVMLSHANDKTHESTLYVDNRLFSRR